MWTKSGKQQTGVGWKHGPGLTGCWENSHASFNLQRFFFPLLGGGTFVDVFWRGTEIWNVMKCWYFVYNHPLRSSKLTLQSKMNHLKMLKRKDFPVPCWFYRRVYYYDPKESSSPFFLPLFINLQKPWRRPTVKKQSLRKCLLRILGGKGCKGQWLNFKLFGITYLVGKISRSNFYFRAQDGWVSPEGLTTLDIQGHLVRIRVFSAPFTSPESERR